MLLGHRSFVVLDGSVSGFTSSDSDHLFDRHHENLSITDFVGPGGFHNRFNRHVDQRVVDHALNLHLGQKVHHVFRTAIKLGMSFLTAKTFDLGHGHPLNTDFCECLSHFVKFDSEETMISVVSNVPVASNFVRSGRKRTERHIEQKEKILFS